MKFEIEYEISLDEDRPNDFGYVTIEAESKEKAIEEFKARKIHKAVITDILEEKE